MRYSREQLAERFAALDAELLRLAAEDAPEEDLWAAFEHLVHVPTASIDHDDRRWWWEQVYAAMERHGLTELSRRASSGR
ncbi:hypothetical protein [Dyella japonica]|uniref:Uncharacterized protein n=1 Tax=Dyella japonica A8 TaxID=1217721 RepID=A0A075K3S8_9GAMM|nr:hypothetical protein [Dyella japonica]AIF48700.1 hypothetical protein HY57_16375 [Dyella japonica A8]